MHVCTDLAISSTAVTLGWLKLDEIRLYLSHRNWNELGNLRTTAWVTMICRKGTSMYDIPSIPISFPEHAALLWFHRSVDYQWYQGIAGGFFRASETMDNLAAKEDQAIALHKAGKWKEAEEMFREVLEGRSRLLGQDHQNTLNRGNIRAEHQSILRTRSNLATVLQDQGKWQEAEEMHREVLQVRIRVLGADYPETLDSRNNLANVLGDQGKRQEAEEMHREVLEARSRVLGADHQNTLSSKNNLANVLQDQGKWQEAEEMYREVLEVRSRLLGADHQETLRCRHNLATVLQEKGKWQEAEEMYREVLEAMSRVLGADHPDTLRSMQNLANAVAHRDRGDWRFRYTLNEAAHFGRLRDAIDKLRTSLAKHTLRVDDEHPDLLRRRVDLAALLVQRNQESDLEEAEDLLRQTIPALQERYGFKDALTLRATRDLVFLLEEQGMDAEEWRQHLPDIEEEADVDMDESLKDCENPEVAELVREFLRLRVRKVDPSSGSGSTAAAAHDASASAAVTCSIAPSQRSQVASEAGSSQCGYAFDATSSDSSAWLKAYEQKLREREERGKWREWRELQKVKVEDDSLSRTSRGSRQKDNFGQFVQVEFMMRSRRTERKLNWYSNITFETPESGQGAFS